MAIKHRDHRHETVAEVRACEATGSQTHADPAPPEERGISEPQRGFIAGLLREREVPEKIAAVVKADADSWSWNQAHLAIDKLKTFPRKPKAAGGYPEFIDGYYALREEDGAVHFYRLSHDEREESRYFGWPVVQAQASDDLHLVKNRDRKITIISAVNADPQAARLLYADELGNCYVCGRTLTDETSRALGIGPICRGKHPGLVYRKENVDAA
jgi:Family of unknown function (DUF6011)